MPFKKIFKKKIQDFENNSIHSENHFSESDSESTQHDESNWLVSYADMMTLLCTFFIMMFALNNMENSQSEKVKEEVSKHFHGEYETPNNDLAKFISQTIQELGVEKDTIVESDKKGVSVTFLSTVFFETLSAELTRDGQNILDQFVVSVLERQKTDRIDFNISIEGHTDRRPILSGIYPSNWELSGSRAARVVRLFLDQGFSDKRIVAIAHGGTRPLHSDRTPAGDWDTEALAKNRRVVIRISPSEESTQEDSAH